MFALETICHVVSVNIELCQQWQIPVFHSTILMPSDMLELQLWHGLQNLSNQIYQIPFRRHWIQWLSWEYSIVLDFAFFFVSANASNSVD
jgi:hypothetical protein